ncbi:MAG: HEAT repeat domain-containing protein [Isosphaeraceae bacterium]
MDETFTTRSTRAGVVVRIVAALLAVGGLPACSNYIGTTAASFLRRVQEDPDPNVRYLAYSKLASPNCYDTPEQKAQAVQVLVAKLERGREPVATRAVICHTLGELRDPSSRDVILKMTSDPEPIVRVEACRALGKVGKPEDATVLTRVMTVDTLEDCRIAAIEALGELRAPDDRINRMLVVGLRSDDPAMRYASLNALRKITGTDAGVEPEGWEKLLEPQTSQTAIAGSSADTARGAAAAEAAIASTGVPAQAQAVYPPRPSPIPLPPVDGSTRPVGYPPAPRAYGQPR